MGFIGSNESSKQSVSRNSSTCSWSKDGLRGHKTGLNQIDTEKATVFLPESEAKNFDIAKPVDYAKGLSDENDYMWLSSDSKSSSLFSSDNSQDNWEFDCWDLSIHDWLSSSSLLSESYDVLSDEGKGFLDFDGFRMSPTGKMPLGLNRPCEDTKGKSLMEELVLQLHEAVRNKVKHSQIGHSESSNSSNEVSLREDLLVSNSPCTSFKTYDDTPSRDTSNEVSLREGLPVSNSPCTSFTYDDTPSCDIDRTGIWVSSLDLETEDSKLIQNREQLFDILDSDFPSPSFSTKQDFQIRPSNHSSRSSIGQTDEVNNATEESDFNEPLFWPFDHNFYRCLELKDFLCLSPRRDGGIGVSGPHESKLVNLRLHQENMPAGRQVNQGCKRRIAFSPTPKSAATERKSRGSSDNGVQKTAASPSRLSKATKASSDQHPCNISKKRRTPHLKIDVPKHASGR